MPKCSSTLVLADDYGDNSCTLHCQLEEGHAGLCTETGDLNGQRYTIVWERPDESLELAASIGHETTGADNEK